MIFPRLMPAAVSALLVAALAGCGSAETPTTTGTATATASATNYTAVSVKNANTGDVSDKLVREASADAVLAQHIKALNGCDWKGLMAQYPDSYELRLPGGTVVKGRAAAGETFAGFVKPHKDGGLCGLTFTEESRQVVNGTLAVQWVAKADFLSEPYRGSDAYITDDGLMVSMVSTFDGSALKLKP